jgi:ribulose 1,5-bisphosphate synthetase/thiazole synthase
MHTITETERDIPVIADVDICVLGGSCTGVFASVRAARLGAKVAIVGRQNRFGGTATTGLVNVWRSLYDEVGEKKIIGGMTEEVIERLKKRDAVVVNDDSPHQYAVVQ